MAHTKAYINLKIENCQRLVDNATSEDQAKVYQGYLDFWSEKLPKKERPEEIAKKAEIKQEKKEAAEAKKAELELIKKENEEAELKKAADIKIKTELIEAKKAELVALQAKKAELVALQAEDVIVEELEITIDDIVDEGILAEDFEIQFPGKKAYRYQNGDKFKTIAFNEYLIKRTQ